MTLFTVLALVAISLAIVAGFSALASRIDYVNNHKEN